MTPVAPPRSSSSKLAAGAGRTPPSARGLGALLIGGGVLLVCLAAPAALAGAQAPAPESHPAGQPVTSQEPAPPAAQPPGPLPPSAGGPGPEPTPPPGDSGSGEATPPPPPGSSPEVSAAGSGSVAILDGILGSDFRFSPRWITVGSGDTVSWTNNGSEPHDVSGGGLDSGILQPGQGYSHTFTSPGTFNYICSIHPQMKGTVIVQGSTSPGGGNGSGGGRGGGSSGQGSAGGTSGGGSTTGPTSESAAGFSPDAAGTSSQLPSTGMPVLPLLATGLGLCLAGAILRRRAALRSSRPGGKDFEIVSR